MASPASPMSPKKSKFNPPVPVQESLETDHVVTSPMIPLGGGISFTDLNLPDDQGTITLVSKDDVEFVVPRQAAMLSGTISAMFGSDSTDTDIVSRPPTPMMSEALTNRINFREIHSDILRQVVRYMHYRLKYDINSSQAVKSPVPEFHLDKETVIDVMMAANFLDL